MAYEGSVGSNHAQPTFDWGAPCGGAGDKRYSYIESCGYSGAAGVLQHMYLLRGMHMSSQILHLPLFWVYL